MASNTDSKKDYLSVDPPIKGQNYVCLSFVSPEANSNCTVRGLKIRGVFDRREDADKHAKKLTEIDPQFDVFVGDVGSWLPWDPDPNSQDSDPVYQNEELNELVKGHTENMEKGKAQYAKRKEEMIKKGAQEEQDKIRNGSDTRAINARKKLQAKQAKRKMNKQLANNGTNIDEDLQNEAKELTQAKKLIEKESQIIENTESNVIGLEEKLNRIKELHEKIKTSSSKASDVINEDNNENLDEE